MIGYDLASIVCVIFGVFGAVVVAADIGERIVHALTRRK